MGSSGRYGGVLQKENVHPAGDKGGGILLGKLIREGGFFTRKRNRLLEGMSTLKGRIMKGTSSLRRNECQPQESVNEFST